MSHKPATMTFTLATRLLVSGQRLRADETISATTVSLNYAAKWQQAKEGHHAVR